MGTGAPSYFLDLIERQLASGLSGDQADNLLRDYEMIPDGDKMQFVCSLIQILVLERRMRKRAALLAPAPEQEDAA